MTERNEFDFCGNVKCGKQLKKSSRERKNKKLCADCKEVGLGKYNFGNSALSMIFKNREPTVPGEDELMFADDPVAVKNCEPGNNLFRRTKW
mgnify:FL=1|jgi:hypothetical protein|tara:strand:+ start:10432 stop:10707 length:276 start_codon:yes stop_codon:yes gene_type:complete